jgi:hypothetical protein
MVRAKRRADLSRPGFLCPTTDKAIAMFCFSIQGTFISIIHPDDFGLRTNQSFRKTMNVMKRGHAAISHEDDPDNTTSKHRKLTESAATKVVSNARYKQDENEHSSHPPTSNRRANEADPETNGPLPRIVTIEHDSEPRSAMLLTDELLAAWKAACEYTRTFAVKLKQVQARREVTDKFRQHANSREVHLWEQWRKRPDDAVTGVVSRNISRQLRGIEEKTKRANEREAEDEEEVAGMRWDLAEKCLQANILVSDALIDHKAMVPDSELEFAIEPDQAFLEFFALSKESERALLGPEHTQEDPGAIHSEGQESEMPAEQVAEQDFDDAYCNLRHAQTEFDQRHRVSAPSSWLIGTPTAEEQLQLDHDQFQQNNQVTRQLIEAEQQFAAAKKAAAELNLDLVASAQTSGFGPIDGDLPGAILSCTRPVVEGAEKDPGIVAWMEAVPDQVCYSLDPHGQKTSTLRKYKMEFQSWAPPNVSSPPEGEYEAHCTPVVRPEHSCSVVDSGPDRKRIDQVDAEREVFRKKVIQHWQKHTSFATGDERVPNFAKWSWSRDLTDQSLRGAGK